MSFKGEYMTLPHIPPRRQDHPRISRRAMLRFGVLGAAGLGVETLLTACSGQAAATVISAATNPPAPTNSPPPTNTSLPTDTAVPTNTPVPPTATPVPTATTDPLRIAGPLDGSSIITLKDGRKLGIIDTGQPDGIPILMHNGTPSSRVLFKSWIEDAKSHGIRLISYDRPGYGDSTSLPDRTVGSAAEDVAAIAKELGLNKFLVLGESGGGPHALACAALLPDLVVAAVTLASPAPFSAKGLDWYEGMIADNIREYRVVLKGRESFKATYWQFLDYIINVPPSGFYKDNKNNLPKVEADALTVDLAYSLLSQAREGLKNGIDGWFDDDFAHLSPWGFEPGQIKMPVMIFHNEEDIYVPFSHGKWLAENIPNAKTNFSKEGGHFAVINRIPEAMTWLLSQWK
jgi:pimeloyl-ACP methyl ester carboxylesterase